mmetsp:Transcript_6171/g.25884  ORF Transcript_6171/g.25884 Transcript_6171/m.25884 type:complete len:410 (+) Transcript_6171:283-1512(+)
MRGRARRVHGPQVRSGAQLVRDGDLPLVEVRRRSARRPRPHERLHVHGGPVGNRARRLRTCVRRMRRVALRRSRRSRREDGRQPRRQVLHRLAHARQDRRHGRHSGAVPAARRRAPRGLRPLARRPLQGRAHGPPRLDRVVFVAILQDAQQRRGRLLRHRRRPHVRQGHGVRRRVRDSRRQAPVQALARSARGRDGRHGAQLLAAHARGDGRDAAAADPHHRRAPRAVQRAVLRRRGAPRRAAARLGPAPAPRRDHRRRLDPVPPRPRLKWRLRRGRRGRRVRERRDVPRSLRRARPACRALRLERQRAQLQELEVRRAAALRAPAHARHHRRRLRRPAAPALRRRRHRQDRLHHRRSPRRDLQRWPRLLRLDSSYMTVHGRRRRRPRRRRSRAPSPSQQQPQKPQPPV